MLASINSATAWFVNISGECGGPTADNMQCACLLPITVTRRPHCVYIWKLIVVFYSAQMTFTENDAPLSASEFVVEKRRRRRNQHHMKNSLLSSQTPLYGFSCPNSIFDEYSSFVLLIFSYFFFFIFWVWIDWYGFYLRTISCLNIYQLSKWMLII